ncbi:hypothetical protein CC78DRAFT_578398 [Lojkania enalia]|uniref:Uncharacterized protein n=1 Tax=Lojkania enalia TaxID=147567 RepID=A0A9P4KDW4_9PLEO|nr:hypothetical protein CC78DRAFT_578398 [Didymosphaeria enalia]
MASPLLRQVLVDEMLRANSLHPSLPATQPPPAPPIGILEPAKKNRLAQEGLLIHLLSGHTSQSAGAPHMEDANNPDPGEAHMNTESQEIVPAEGDDEDFDSDAALRSNDSDDDAPEAKSFQGIYESGCDIYTWSGSDHRFDIRGKLDFEFRFKPLSNTTMEDDAATQADISHRLALIYITDFFTNGVDFCMYVKGQANIARLMGGTFGAKPYNGPFFATPVEMHERDEILGGNSLTSMLDRVSRTETKGMRFKYLYDTCYLAWERLDYDADKDARLRRAASEEARRMTEPGEMSTPRSPPPEEGGSANQREDSAERHGNEAGTG